MKYYIIGFIAYDYIHLLKACKYCNLIPVPQRANIS